MASKFGGNNRNRRERIGSRIVGKEDLPESRRIYLFTQTGLREATKGYDFGQVVKALDAAGAFAKKDPAGKTAAVVWTPRGIAERLYHIDPEKLR